MNHPLGVSHFNELILGSIGNQTVIHHMLDILLSLFWVQLVFDQ